MSIYSEAPPLRSFRDDKATLLVCWWCTCFAAVIILFRVSGRFVRTERLFREDWLALACLAPLFIRMGFVHVILLFGTNNTVTTGLSDQDVRRREIGSRLVLASRIFYAATLWMLKLTITEFFKRLTISIWRRSYELMLQSIRWFLLVSFIAVVIADLAECQPITNYWQVVPDPGGRCRQGYAQLLTMGSADIITDILLVVFPIPIIVRSRMSFKRKVQLTLLFGGSLLPAGTTLFRIPTIIDRHGSQQYRSLLASIEILFATTVANALVLGSFIRDRGVKKQRWKAGSITDSIGRTTSRQGTAVRHWGSDEDLVRELGLGVNPELRQSDSQIARPAPMATSALSATSPRKEAGDRDWHFSRQGAERCDTSEDLERTKMGAPPPNSSDVTSLSSPRRMNFFDVGGLLDEDKEHDARRVSSIRTTDTEATSLADSSNPHPPYASQWGVGDGQRSGGNGLSPAPPMRGSSALLQDIGGLLGPRIRRDPPTNGVELQTIHQEGEGQSSPSLANHDSRLKKMHTLQDVGGLLK